MLIKDRPRSRQIGSSINSMASSMDVASFRRNKIAALSSKFQSNLIPHNEHCNLMQTHLSIHNSQDTKFGSNKLMMSKQKVTNPLNI
jgi:hypothetical protein